MILKESIYKELQKEATQILKKTGKGVLVFLIYYKKINCPYLIINWNNKLNNNV